MSDSFIRWFRDITLQDVPLVGGKNASLGELYRELRRAGVRVPNGFAITAGGYRHFLGPAAWRSGLPIASAGCRRPTSPTSPRAAWRSVSRSSAPSCLPIFRIQS